MVAGTFGYRTSSDLLQLLKDSLELRFNHFDTSPSYSNHAQLGEALSTIFSTGGVKREDVFLIDKIDGWQMQETEGKVAGHVADALRDLKTEYMDLLLIHWPFPSFLVETWQSFEELKKQGVAKSIGVCNVEMRHLNRLLEKAKTPPDFVQNERHPLNQAEEVSNFCLSQGISLQAYSPVCRMVPKIAESLALQAIASAHGRSLGQVIMRWHLQSGVSPVFMTTKRERLVEYRQTYDFELTPDDMSRIDAMNEDYKLFLPSRACPGF
jgi:diketogulonate reductase-like aldo/keto reductase